MQVRSDSMEKAISLVYDETERRPGSKEMQQTFGCHASALRMLGYWERKLVKAEPAMKVHTKTLREWLEIAKADNERENS